jgi:hypothetical protein
VDWIAQGKPLMQVAGGTRYLGNNFYELRGKSIPARVIVRQIGPKTFEIIGKFQGHARGDAANDQIIERLIEGVGGQLSRR